MEIPEEGASGRLSSGREVVDETATDGRGDAGERPMAVAAAATTNDRTAVEDAAPLVARDQRTRPSYPRSGDGRIVRLVPQSAATDQRCAFDSARYGAVHKSVHFWLPAQSVTQLVLRANWLAHSCVASDRKNGPNIFDLKIV